jgi:hypothetical protein
VVGRHAGDLQRREPLGERSHHREVIALRQAEHADRDRRPDHRDEHPRDPWPPPLEREDHQQADDTDTQRRVVRLAVGDPADERPYLGDHALRVGREAEELGQLTEQHGQRDPVHVAVADGLGQQVGDEPEAGEPGEHAQQAREDRQHAGQGDGFGVAAGGQGEDRGRDQRGQGGVRTKDEDPARAGDGVDDQRNDGGVEPVDRREPGGLRIPHAGRYQQRGEHDPGHDIAGQP